MFQPVWMSVSQWTFLHDKSMLNGLSTSGKAADVICSLQNKTFIGREAFCGAGFLS